MSSSRYREVDPSLPWMGASPLGPRRLRLTDAEAVMASTDPVALALMHGYARSYAAATGGGVLSIAAAAALGLVGRRREAALAALSAGWCAAIVVEARRRARRWEAVIEARLAMVRMPEEGA